MFAAGLAFADSSPQTATYIDGNVAGVAPKTGGTLLFAGDQTMNFRTGLATVPVPYANISHAELGAVVETSKSHPFYKVWEIRKHKPQNQYLIVNFANEEGEQKTMTLELDASRGARGAWHHPDPQCQGRRRVKDSSRGFEFEQIRETGHHEGRSGAEQ